MTLYSHSKIQTFEECPYKFKLKYLDKIPSPLPPTIEAFLGSCVHTTFEWLYNEVLNKKLPGLDEVIKKYSEIWQQGDNNEFLIVNNLKKEDYFNKGVKFLVDYYVKHQPFNDGTVELEKKIWVNLEKNFPHKFIGYIDRLAFNPKTGEYEIHDYKTANTLPPEEKFKTDRQLAIYSLGLKQIIGHDKEITLNWHYLNYNRKITSRRTNEELEKLRRETIEKIKIIELATEYPCKKSRLCDWCEYKPYCKAWGNSLPEKYRHEQTKLETQSKEKPPQKETNNKKKQEFPTLFKYLKED